MSSTKENRAPSAKTQPGPAETTKDFDEKNYNSFTMFTINDTRLLPSLIPQNTTATANRIANYSVNLAQRLDESNVDYRPLELVFSQTGDYMMCGQQLEITKRMPTHWEERNAAKAFMKDNKLTSLAIVLTFDDPVCVRWSRNEDVPVEYVGVVTY